MRKALATGGARASFPAASWLHPLRDSFARRITRRPDFRFRVAPVIGVDYAI
jgi:hypothetical protein